MNEMISEAQKLAEMSHSLQQVIYQFKLEE
jgi:hypothetical protein